MTDIFDIHFELSNEDRKRIMCSLLVEGANLTNLSRKLELKNQETSRHLSRLESSGLVEKTTNGTFRTTPLGEICINKDKELAFLVENREYFNTHLIKGLPESLQVKIGLLANSEFIDDTLVSLQIVKRIIDEAEDSLFRLSSQFMMMLIDPVVEAANRGIEYTFIYSADIKLPPDATQTVRLRDAADRGTFKSYTHRNIQVFMVMSEKEIVLAFPTVNGKYDYTGFHSKDENVLGWGRELFDYYMVDKLPPKPLWSDIPRE